MPVVSVAAAVASRKPESTLRAAASVVDGVVLAATRAQMPDAAGGGDLDHPTAPLDQRPGQSRTGEDLAMVLHTDPGAQANDASHKWAER